jgi:hypothetical protein
VTRELRKNTAASIRARLLSLAQSKGEDYQRVLGRYAIERFLYRLAGRHIGTNLPSREPYSLRCGQATLTGPQRIWIYSDVDRPPPSEKLKRLFGRSARFSTKTGLSSTASRSKAHELKRMTSTMACASSSRPSRRGRGSDADRHRIWRCHLPGGLGSRNLKEGSRVSGKLILEGEPQSELDLPGGAERVNACSYPDAVYVVPGGSGSIDLSRGSRQQSIERGPR